MEDRYEIKGKVGQGGLGEVYLANDLRMNREVAIKRIITDPDDESVTEEGTRQLIEEAGALSALQHPNIVTVYDVGSDSEGPFVVMEFLKGETLEDIITRTAFIYDDFRQLAKQSLEGLIAAQELHFVHRDIKPGNIMLCWLPSGKFQIKIVDFGLAKLSTQPSLQTMDQSDGVFGSIYFMAPEQFERAPLDLKTDLYALGCVYYYALTGLYPFDGENATEVMVSHLQHHVTPISEIQEGLPLWLCDWVMWHINRNPSDRPESARQALQFFIDNEQADSSPALSLGKNTPPTPVSNGKVKLKIPGAVPEPVKEPEATDTKDKRIPKEASFLTPPEGHKPRIQTSSQVIATAASDTEIAQEQPTPDQLFTAAPLKSAAPTALTGSAPLGKKPISTLSKKQSSLSGAKIAIIIVLAALAILLFTIILNKSGTNSDAEAYNEVMQALKVPDVSEITINQKTLQILLNTATDVGSNTDRGKIYKALSLARANDGTDLGLVITNFVINTEMPPAIQLALFKQVIEKRKDPTAAAPLLAFAQSSKSLQATVAALSAMGEIANEEHLPALLAFIETAMIPQVRQAAESAITGLISRSSSKESLSKKLKTAYNNSANSEARFALIRLSGKIGDRQSLELIQQNLKSDSKNDRIAAMASLAGWKDTEGFTQLIEYFEFETDTDLKARALDAALKYLRNNDEADTRAQWTQLVEVTKTTDEKVKAIKGLASFSPQPWSYDLLEKIKTDAKKESTTTLADRAIKSLKRRAAAIEKNKLSE